jgi:Ca-activated chloride channel family protein
MRVYKASQLISIFVLGFLFLGNFSSVSKAQSEKTLPASEIILILDASGSMWGQIEGQNKISIAKEVLKNLITGLPENAKVGLIAYGHRDKGDCKDIETIVPPGPLDKALINKKIEELNPKGKTPITDSVLTAFDLVRTNENATTVILVSDGIETCGGDPCKAVKEAKDSGINFIMHVVGVDVGDVDVSQLECAAQAGGGLYLTHKTQVSFQNA